MCGRFTLRVLPEELEKRFNAKLKGFLNYKPRYNIAPGQEIPVITETKPDEIIWMRWGMMPGWWKQQNRGLINIRSESVFTKNIFKNMTKSHCCLIPADGFYEWKSQGKHKIPYYFNLKDNALFAFAGFWSDDKDGLSCAILTTEPNSLVGEVHDRMPCIFEEKCESDWMSTGTTDSKIQKLLSSYPAAKMNGYEVSRKVNVSSNEGKELIDEVGFKS